jgi:hypothetical protein
VATEPHDLNEMGVSVHSVPPKLAGPRSGSGARW